MGFCSLKGINMTTLREGNIVRVEIGFERPDGEKHQKTALVLDKKNEHGVTHYFCQLLEENECYVDAIHAEQLNGKLHSTLCLSVNYSPFGCMKDIAKYMGYQL